jgi:tRNA-dihydrouridine synthase
MQNFWKELPRPFTVLAPLDGVTDVVFRQMVVKMGKPDVLFTEFTMTEGLFSHGHERVMQRLMFNPNEQPVVAQIWGTKPEMFFKTAQLVRELGFTGIDINMGCPDRTVIRGGACSALIKNPTLAAEIIQATKEGAGGLPLSVKTRIGFERKLLEEWIGFLLKQDLATLTVHLRTVAEQSKVPAHWELMPQIMELRKEIAPNTIIVGNGDILSLDEIKEKYEQYGCEGYMVGRGIFANPWMFNPKINIHEVTVQQRISLYLEHINEFEKTWQGQHHFALLKKFGKTYINTFPESASFREKLMLSKDIEELKEVLLSYQ